MVDYAFMDFEKFKSFNEKLQLMKQVDGSDECRYLFIGKETNRVKCANSLSFVGLDDFKYLVVFGRLYWKSDNGAYTNSGLMLLGMFDANFDMVKKIPCSKGNIVDVEFKSSGYSGFDRYSPRLVVEDNNGNLTEMNESNTLDLAKLFSQVLAQ